MDKNDNQELVMKVKEHLIGDELTDKLASFFKVMGDPTRMRIISCLSISSLCVNDLAAALDMTQSAISHQLKSLKNEGLIKSRRDGKNIYYSLDDDHVVHIIDQATIHIKHKISDQHI